MNELRDILTGAVIGLSFDALFVTAYFALLTFMNGAFPYPHLLN